MNLKSSANCKHKKDEENLSKAYHIKLLKTSDEKKISKQPEKSRTPAQRNNAKETAIS